jgi:ArsR family transcriptional regulator, nickel/cobalt-responsive transcriptional repressor
MHARWRTRAVVDRMNDTLQSNRCAELLKAIADPDRLRIVQCLQQGPLNVGQLAIELGRDLGSTSHHLGVLRHAGFVLAEKHGKFVVYSLNPEFFTTNPKDEGPNRIELGCCHLVLT